MSFKDLTFKAKDNDLTFKDLTFKARDKDLSFKAKDKDLSFKAKAEDLKIVLKDSLSPRPRTPVIAQVQVCAVFICNFYVTIRYDTRCYFNVRSKADTSRFNLPHGDDN